jgi:putative protease
MRAFDRQFHYRRFARDCPSLRKQSVRTYLTLNTIIYDHDLSVVKTLLAKAKDAGITAVIASDQAVIAMARQLGIEVHISTQLNITNIETIRFYSLFADTMVLSRELSLRQVKSITEQIAARTSKGQTGIWWRLKFGHGALCMAVSGKCYLSLHSHNSSANRGACKQNCRKKYTVIDQESGFEIEVDNEYLMSPKDLCTLDFLDQVIDSGIQVLKIEGRGRAPEYVATVVKTYRDAIDSITTALSLRKKSPFGWKHSPPFTTADFGLVTTSGKNLANGAPFPARWPHRKKCMWAKARIISLKPISGSSKLRPTTSKPATRS